MAVPCEPPFCIYQLNYINMCRWKDSEDIYQEALERLVKGIEEARDDRIDFRTWDQDLKPWDFTAFLGSSGKSALLVAESGHADFTEGERLHPQRGETSTSTGLLYHAFGIRGYHPMALTLVFLVGDSRFGSFLAQLVVS